METSDKSKYCHATSESSQLVPFSAEVKTRENEDVSGYSETG